MRNRNTNFLSDVHNDEDFAETDGITFEGCGRSAGLMFRM